MLTSYGRLKFFRFYYNFNALIVSMEVYFLRDLFLQAADTDISALVEIEKSSPHRFEFFMGLVGDQPICARTAWAYAKAGGRISHALSVYSCQLRQPSQVRKFLHILAKHMYEDHLKSF